MGENKPFDNVKHDWSVSMVYQDQQKHDDFGFLVTLSSIHSYTNICETLRHADSKTNCLKLPETAPNAAWKLGYIAYQAKTCNG